MSEQTQLCDLGMAATQIYIWMVMFISVFCCCFGLFSLFVVVGLLLVFVFLLFIVVCFFHFVCLLICFVFVILL